MVRSWISRGKLKKITKLPLDLPGVNINEDLKPFQNPTKLYAFTRGIIIRRFVNLGRFTVWPREREREHGGRGGEQPWFPEPRKHRFSKTKKKS